METLVREYPTYDSYDLHRSTMDGDTEVMDFNEFLGYLINIDVFNNDKERGIAKFVLNNGTKSLSEKQAYVFAQIIEANGVGSCEGCADDVPWSEMIEAKDNGGFCSHCANALGLDE